MALQDDRLVITRQKQELERISEKASHEAGTQKKSKKEMRQKLKIISKGAAQQNLIWLPKRSYGQFVAWKGNWSKGRAFVESETGASVKNRSGEKFLISGDKIAVERAINMIVTQSLTAVASSDDYKILDAHTNQKSQKNSFLKEAPAKPKSSVSVSSGSASIDKDADGNPMWDLGNMKKVVVRNFMGKTYIDIREYYVDKGALDIRPGKKGMSLNRLQYQKLKSVLDDIDHALPLSSRIQKAAKAVKKK